MYCLNDPLNRTDPTGEYFGLVGRVREQVDSIEMYYGALDAALGATGNPADMLDWLPGMNDFREYLFSPQKLNRASSREIAWGYVFEEVGNVCDWGALARCIGGEYLSGLKYGVPLVLVGELSCLACYSSFEPVSKTGFCVACGIYRYSSGARAAANLVNLVDCADKHCNIPLLQER